MVTSVDPVLAFLVDDLTALSKFGVSVEMTVVVGSFVVVGVPVADSEYFTHLGEQFRQTVEQAFGTLDFHQGTDAGRELEQGWHDDQLKQLARAREQGYRLLGEDAQQAVRARVQGRPERIREYPRDKNEEQALVIKLAELLGDDAAPNRQFLHLRNASILDGETVAGRFPYWRVRLSDVSAWNLGQNQSVPG